MKLLDFEKTVKEQREAGAKCGYVPASLRNAPKVSAVRKKPNKAMREKNSAMLLALRLAYRTIDDKRRFGPSGWSAAYNSSLSAVELLIKHAENFELPVFESSGESDLFRQLFVERNSNGEA